MRYVVPISIVLIFFSCSYKGPNDLVLRAFSKVENLKMKSTMIKSSEIGEIVDLLVIDSFLISDEIFSKKIFKLYNLRTGKLLSNFINKGKGPNEMIFPHLLNYYDSDCFTSFDSNSKELIYFSLNEILNQNYQFHRKEKIEFTTEKSFAAKSYLLNDSMLLCTGFLKKGQYCIYNLNSKNSEYFLDYPYDEKHKGETNETKGQAFQCEISIKPDRKKFANVTGAIFEICEFHNIEINRIFRKVYYFPVYKVVQNHAAFDSTQPYGFHSITSTDSFIFMIYSGRSMKEYGDEYYAGKNLLVFDWNGNPVVNFILDRYLKRYTLDASQMKIYGYCTNPISGEPEIVTYQLPEIKR